ncbi:MAG: tetratricopeptide repeat protein, partial [Myxococcales bacterium]|nr:tetratricopeptide repeat protein [Myxococcales bacterium]
VAASPVAASPVAASPVAASPRSDPPLPVAASPVAASPIAPSPRAAAAPPVEAEFVERPAAAVPRAPIESAPAISPAEEVEAPEAPRPSRPIPTEADAPSGTDVGHPDGVDEVLTLLREHRVFEPAGEPRQARWMGQGDVPRVGTRIGKALLGLWVVAILLGVAGYVGFRAYVAHRHEGAAALVEGARAASLAGDHRHLVEAERDLRLAREMNPHDTTGLRVLLFVQSQRALEEGAFEPAYLRPTLAKAEKKGLTGDAMVMAQAILDAAEGRTERTKKALDKALASSPKDPFVLYIAGRLAQRLGRADSVELLERAVAAEPKLAAAALALAEAQGDRGQREEALALLTGVLTQYGSHLRAALWKAFMTADSVDPAEGLSKADELGGRLEVGAPTDRVILWLTRARLYRRLDDMAKATAAVDEAVGAGASEPRLLALVASAATSVGLLDRAQVAASAAVNRAPTNPEYRQLLAEILLARRDGVRALKHLGLLSTDDPDVLVMSAEAALLVGSEAALTASTEALARSRQASGKETPVRVEALHVRTRVALGQGSRVFSEARRLAKGAPGDRHALVALGEVALSVGRGDVAVEALTDLVAADGENADAHFLLGRGQRLVNQPELAEASFRKAIALSPRHTDAREALGRLLLDLGKYAEADQVYAGLAEEAGFASGQSTSLRGRLGRVEALIGLGKVADARVQYESVPEDDRNHPSAVLVSAHLAMAEGRPGEAVSALRPLTEEDGVAADTLALYGDALFEVEQTEAAAQAYERALGMDPGLPEALLGKVKGAVRAEKPKDADKYLTQAADSLKARIRPPRVQAMWLYLRGRALLLDRRAKAEDTRKALRDAVALPGAPPAAWFFLGESLAAANSPEAYDAYARYLELEPEGYYRKRAERAMARK